MKITKRQLRQIIKEAMDEAPRMSGMMDPEPQEVMDDIERQRNQSAEERVAEIYAQEISDLAMIIAYADPESQEVAFMFLAEDPRNDVDSIEPGEKDIIWNLALLESEDL